FPREPIPDAAAREAFVAAWEAAPERFRQWFRAWEPGGELPVDVVVDVVDWCEAMHYVDDALGLCPLLSSFRGQYGGRPPYHLYNLAPFVAHAAGIDCTPETLLAAARRTRTLVRAINASRGVGLGGGTGAAGAELLGKYCASKGWSPQGVPLRRTLEDLGLGDVAEALESLGAEGATK
ncbi:MAG: aldehyde dehydrogenase, partial [Deltaproteobacteria bacterium]|nr:aldehyde dehydrogenase [Deltaproteobacteria bacterium]